jgi:nitrite reductase (cytochrome c-552)
MTTNNSAQGVGGRRTTLLVVITAILTIAVVALLVNIFERKQEAKNTFMRVVEVNDQTEDPAIWGKNFPSEYEGYLLTSEMKKTMYGGSEAMPRQATADDPRTTTARSKLEQDPRLVTMWANYPFSKDYRERRGHAYMLDDQTYTGRQKAAPQAGACINCHASLYTVYRKVGNGDATKGFETINHMSYPEVRALVKHPIACIDCHDPKTMQLRISRPAFLEGIKAYKASQGIADYDPNKQATRQEMRSYVCAQCHVTYYFKGAEKRLTFPWDKGLKVENIFASEDAVPVKEWVHAQTGASLIKARHPEFELWSQGIHARSGVACADCHMPYKREGGVKVSDHHVQSPLLNINRACQSCHRWDEKELKSRVEDIQTAFFTQKNEALDALMDLIKEIKAAKEAGATDEQLAKARDYQRKAGFYLDFIMSENSMGFHAPQEAQRVLGESLNLARLGQLSLRDQLKGTAPTLKAANQAPKASASGK